MDHQVGIAVIGRLAQVDEHQLISPVIVDKPGGGIDIQGGAAHDQNLRIADVVYGAGKHILIQRLLVQHDIRPDHTAAAAAGHALAVVHQLRRVGLAALGAVGAKDTAVKLQHILAAGSLVQPVDILGQHRPELSLLLQPRKGQMGPVGLYAVNDQLFPVEAVILLRVASEKACAENGLRRVLPLLVVQSVHTAKVGNSRFRTDSGPAKKHDVVTFGYPLSQGLYFFVHFRDLPQRIV